MRSDEFNQNTAERVRHVNNEPKLVPAQIEDGAVIADKVDSRAELSFHVGWAAPPCLARGGKPQADWTLGPRMTLPELFKRPTGDHLHVSCLSRHQNGDKAYYRHG